MQRQLGAGAVPDRHSATTFHGGRAVPVGAEAAFDHQVRAGNCRVRIAGIERAGDDEVVGRDVVNRFGWICGGADSVDMHPEFVVGHLHQLGGVGRCRCRGGDHRRDGLALVAHLVGCEHRLGGVHMCLQRRLGNERQTGEIRVGAGRDIDHADGLPGSRYVNRDDPRMGHRAPNERHGELPVVADVGDVAAAPSQQPTVFTPGQRLAERTARRRRGLIQPEWLVCHAAVSPAGAWAPSRLSFGLALRPSSSRR